MQHTAGSGSSESGQQKANDIVYKNLREIRDSKKLKDGAEVNVICILRSAEVLRRSKKNSSWFTHFRCWDDTVQHSRLERQDYQNTKVAPDEFVTLSVFDGSPRQLQPDGSRSSEYQHFLQEMVDLVNDTRGGTNGIILLRLHRARISFFNNKRSIVVSFEKFRRYGRPSVSCVLFRADKKTHIELDSRPTAHSQLIASPNTMYARNRLRALRDFWHSKVYVSSNYMPRTPFVLLRDLTLLPTSTRRVCLAVRIWRLFQTQKGAIAHVFDGTFRAPCPPLPWPEGEEMPVKRADRVERCLRVASVATASVATDTVATHWQFKDCFLPSSSSLLWQNEGALIECVHAAHVMRLRRLAATCAPSETSLVYLQDVAVDAQRQLSLDAESDLFLVDLDEDAPESPLDRLESEDDFVQRMYIREQEARREFPPSSLTFPNDDSASPDRWKRFAARLVRRHVGANLTRASDFRIFNEQPHLSRALADSPMAHVPLASLLPADFAITSADLNLPKSPLLCQVIGVEPMDDEGISVEDMCQRIDCERAAEFSDTCSQNNDTEDQAGEWTWLFVLTVRDATSASSARVVCFGEAAGSLLNQLDRRLHGNSFPLEPRDLRKSQATADRLRRLVDALLDQRHWLWLVVQPHVVCIDVGMGESFIECAATDVDWIPHKQYTTRLFLSMDEPPDAPAQYSQVRTDMHNTSVSTSGLSFDTTVSFIR